MIYNNKRIAVWQWTGDESLCPECQSELIAKRGEIVCWHWAHHPNTSKKINCPHKESEWHLAMKSAYLGFVGWDIEVPIVVYGNTYRADAMNRNTKRIREFVHSLSPHYIDKHYALQQSGYDVLWIMDGEEFVSKRWKYCSSKKGRKNLLKPIALNFHNSVPVLVHWEESLWKCWQNNIWYQCIGESAQEVIKQIKEGKSLWQNQQQSKM